MVCARLSPDPSASGVIRYPDYALAAPARDRDGNSWRPGRELSRIGREFADWHPWVFYRRLALKLRADCEEGVITWSLSIRVASGGGPLRIIRLRLI